MVIVMVDILTVNISLSDEKYMYQKYLKQGARQHCAKHERTTPGHGAVYWKVNITITINRKQRKISSHRNLSRVEHCNVQKLRHRLAR